MKSPLLSFIFIFFIGQNGFSQWVQQNSGTPNYLSSVYFVNDSVGYMGDEYGYVYKSINGGINWSILGLHGEYVYFLSGDTGFAGQQGINKTTDGGNSWFPVMATNHFITDFHFPDSDTGYASGLNLNTDSIFLYKTTDRGNSWTEIHNHLVSIPAISAEIFFTSTDTGYLAADCIQKTVDGGNSWFIQDCSGVFSGIHFLSANTGYAISSGEIFKTVDGQNWINLNNNFPGTINSSLFFTSNDTGYIAGGNGSSVGSVLKTTNGGLNWTNDLTTPYTFQSIFFLPSQKSFLCGFGGVFYTQQSTVGIENIAMNKIQFGPNPTTGKIQFYGGDSSYAKIIVTDLLGVERLTCASNECDISSLEKGIYLITLESNNRKMTSKVILN